MTEVPLEFGLATWQVRKNSLLDLLFILKEWDSKSGFESIYNSLRDVLNLSTFGEISGYLYKIKEMIDTSGIKKVYAFISGEVDHYKNSSTGISISYYSSISEL